MTEFIYDNKIIQIVVNNDEAFRSKLDKMISLGIASSGNYESINNGCLNIYQFTQGGKIHYVYEELTKTEIGLKSYLCITDSKIESFVDLISRSKDYIRSLE